MRDSGRWDLQLHAGAMHKMVRIDAKGTQGAAYANRIWADGRLESFAAYRRRVTSDLELGMRRLRKELGPVRADLFAYPFSADGSWQTNDRADPRLPRPGPPRALLRGLQRRPPAAAAAHRPAHA